MEEFEKNKLNEVAQEEPAAPTTYPGSGLHKNPARMMKIEEVVEWDMDFGVKMGPVGFDHRLTCPYCRKRMLLVSHEGSRHQKFIRIVYECENCAAHTVVQFSAPNQKLDLPELSLGEKIIIETPTPVPNLSQENPGMPEARINDRNRKNRPQLENRPQPGNRNNTAPVENQNRQDKPDTRNTRNRNPRNNQPDARKSRTPEQVLVKPGQIMKQPIAKLPGEQIKKTSQSNAAPSPQPQQPEKRSNAYFRSRRKPNPQKKPTNEN